MRLIGLDPGLRRTGWGVIESDGSRLRFVAAGVIEGAGEALAERLAAIHDGVSAVVRRFAPGEAAVEETVVNRNADSSLKLGHARGVVLLAAAQAGLRVSEYASKRVKRALTGTGAATKEQVAVMVGHLLPGFADPRLDATDALAVAICHAHERTTLAALSRVAAVAGR